MSASCFGDRTKATEKTRHGASVVLASFPNAGPVQALPVGGTFSSAQRTQVSGIGTCLAGGAGLSRSPVARPGDGLAAAFPS